MSRLSSSDYEQMLDFVGVLYEARDHRAFSERFVAHITSLIPCDIASVKATDLSREPPNGSRSSVQEGAKPSVTAIPWSASAASPQHPRETLLPLRCTLAVTLALQSTRKLIIALGCANRTFNDRDRFALSIVAPHVRRAYLNLSVIEAAQGNGMVEFLTRREREILDLVAAGATNPQIGEVLRISARTVQKHLEHIYAKLGVGSRTAATIRVLRTGYSAR